MKIEDLVNVETEHMVGERSGPLVKLRAESEHTVLLGQLTPEQARDIANHLFEAAARAEYEGDLLSEMKGAEWADEMIAGIFHMVRSGETKRHTKTEGF